MEARKNNDTAAVKALKKEGDGITQEATEKVIYPFIKSHATSPLALYVLQSDATRDKNTKMLQSLFDMLSDEIKNSAAGKALQAKLLAGDKAGGSVSMLDNMSIGGTAPDFTQNDTGGKPVTLSSFRGKYVLLDFWASWCAPCRRENPNVVKAYTQYHPKGFDILSVSLDKPGDKDKWLKAIQDDGLTWTQVSDLQYFDNAVAKQYGIQGIPQNFLIDPQGKIIAKGLRGDDLEKKLEEIYKD
jgi:peroxiredoxin